MQVPAHDVAIMSKVVAKLKTLSKHHVNGEATEALRVGESRITARSFERAG